jgi:hypothetical protein
LTRSFQEQAYNVVTGSPYDWIQRFEALDSVLGLKISRVNAAAASRKLDLGNGKGLGFSSSGGKSSGSRLRDLLSGGYTQAHIHNCNDLLNKVEHDLIDAQRDLANVVWERRNDQLIEWRRILQGQTRPVRDPIKKYSLLSIGPVEVSAD